MQRLRYVSSGQDLTTEQDSHIGERSMGRLQQENHKKFPVLYSFGSNICNDIRLF
jgi:hypothetical protein